MPEDDATTKEQLLTAQAAFKEALALFPLRYYPSKHLSLPCEPVVFSDEDKDAIERTVAYMKLVMKRSGGIGLAANQIGINKRILVWCQAAEEGAMINPEIIGTKGKGMHHLEGCLSFPGLSVKKWRLQEIVVKWWDEQGKSHTKEFTGDQAICIQHEIDHLNGVTMIDELSRLKRDVINRKLKKTLKQRGVRNNASVAN